MNKFQTFGASTPEESDRERKNKALARRIAAEGIVLLENNGALPLNTKKVALYGVGSRMTVKGGTGSGDVHERHSVTIEEGLLNAGFTFPTTLWMDRFVGKYDSDIEAWRTSVEDKIKGFSPLQTTKMFDIVHEYPKPCPSCTPIVEDELTDECDTAIYVLSRQAGEGKDRRVEQGDYLLSETEEESLKLLSKHYAKLILVLNCGSVMDLSIMDKTRIDAVIFYGQGGMEGGNALADLLTGKESFSGKLTDTWAVNYRDYPCSDTFSHMNGNLDQEDYREGIYVGYRYFNTAGIKPRYPFGFGLSYTNFTYGLSTLSNQLSEISLDIKVKNTGELHGKEVIQLYISKPNKKHKGESISLAVYGKTKLLAPSEETTITLNFDLRDVAVFDEEGSRFVLEQGQYGLFLGNSSDNLSACAVVELLDEAIVEEVDSICENPRGFEDMVIANEAITYDSSLPIVKLSKEDIKQILHEKYEHAFTAKVDGLLKNLSVEDKIALVTGGGYALKSYNSVMGAAGRTCTKLLNKGIPNIILADGPAGLNVNQSIVILKNGSQRYPDGLPEDWRWGWVRKIEPLMKAKPGKGRSVYRFMTAWPCETVQAQSFNLELVEEVGKAIGHEMLEIGVSVWLAPGLNIHRNPLCGRNFEYYSEDPLVSGKMAAAITRGVQSYKGIGVTIKHFCCNNQEDNRNRVSENVSEKALRELYLKGFRIAISEGKPWCLMTCYNQVNNTYVCNSNRFCKGVLRDEWGFDGLVMSDWNATDQCSHGNAINAGNDLIMPGNNWVEKQLNQAYKEGKLDAAALDISAGRVLSMIFASDTCKDFI